MTFMLMTDVVRRPLRGACAGRSWQTSPGVARPVAAALRMTWQPAPDGRGLVAQWSEEPGRWFAPVSFRAAPPPNRSCRPRLEAAMRRRLAPRRAAA
jgi:hypothetical protein